MCPTLNTTLYTLKAHCRGTDWVNKTIRKNRIWQPSVISLYREIHEDDNDLTAFILETKYDPRFGNCSEAMSFVGDLNTTINQSKPRQCTFKGRSFPESRNAIFFKKFLISAKVGISRVYINFRELGFSLNFAMSLCNAFSNLPYLFLLVLYRVSQKNCSTFD